MTEKLKPCPFCGSVADIVEYISGVRHTMLRVETVNVL